MGGTSGAPGLTEVSRGKNGSSLKMTVGSVSDQSLNSSFANLKNVRSMSWQEEEESDKVPIPPDGGWGWVVVFASFMCNVILDGIAYTFGVLLTPLVAYFTSDKSTVSWVGSLLCGMYMLSGPVVGGLVNKFGCRPVCMTGAVIAWASISLSTLSVNISMLMLTYGVMGGFGLGLIYLPAVVSVGFYFESKRALATGISVCGSGVGTFIFAPLANYLLKEFDWKTSNLIFASICLLCLIFGWLMRPLEEVKEECGLPDENMGVVLPDGTRAVAGPGGSPAREIFRVASPIRRVETLPKITEEDFGPDNGTEGLKLGEGDDEDKTEKPRRQRKDSENIKIGRNYSTSFLRPYRRESEASSIYSNNSLKFMSSSKTKLARPMSRRDIFYSGSMHHLGQVQGQEETAALSSNCHSYVSIRGQGSQNFIPRNSLIDSRMEVADGEKEKEDSGGGIGAVVRSMLDPSLLKDPQFTLICISNIFGFLGFYVPFVYLPSMAASHEGISSDQAAFLLSIIGISNTVGRIMSGWISDFSCVDSLFVVNCSLILSAICVFLIPFTTSYEMLVFLGLLFGLFIAAYISLTSIVLVDLMGLENLTSAFGLLTMCRGAASIVGPPLAGAVFEATDSLRFSFFLAGGFLATAGLTSILADCVRRCKKKEKI